MMPQRELVTILSHPKVIDSQNPLKLFKCFTLPLWSLILTIYFVHGLLYWRNIEHYFPQSSSSGGGRLYRFISAYLEMFGLSIGKGSITLSVSHIDLVSNPMYLYIMVIFLFRHLFSSDITAVLLSQENTVIDHFEQLKTMSNIRLLLQAKSSTQVAFNTKFPELVGRVVEIRDEEMASAKTIARLIGENYVLVINGYYGESLQSQYSFLGLHLSAEGYLSSLNNYAIRKTLDTSNKEKLAKL